MIYKFKSKASGDIIMMGPTGDALLRALGRAPAPKGIIEPADMAAAMVAIEQAVVADEAVVLEADDDCLFFVHGPLRRGEAVSRPNRLSLPSEFHVVHPLGAPGPSATTSSSAEMLMIAVRSTKTRRRLIGRAPERSRTQASLT